MADKKTKHDSVDKLLAEKQQLEEWIERLDLAGNEVAEDVRIRVRNDYDGRLAAVLKELHQYADELSDSLAVEVKNREALWEKEKAGTERLAEAQLRHTVGEHSDKEWLEIQAKVDETLSTVRAELEKATAEIGRLEDVLGAMSAAPNKPPNKAKGAEAPSDRKAAGSAKSHQEGDGQPQTDAFGEKDLTLIKSTTADAAGQKASAKPVEVPAKEPELNHIPRPSSIGLEAPLPKADKTLKCGECSAMNFPTEWYCENCGAELAAL